MSTATGTADISIATKGYVHPDALVSTEWLAEHLDDPAIRIVESDEDVLLYDTGHIPGAVKVDWHADLNDALVRDYISAPQFEELLRAHGIDQSTTVVFYGDKNNWWAAYALWVFHLFGFTNTKILDGGRVKWEKEGRPMTTDVAEIACALRVQGRPPRRRTDPRVHERRSNAPGHRGQARRRSLARRVHRQEAAHGRVPAGGRAARRTHPGGEERSLGASRQRRRHLQVRRRAARDLRERTGALTPSDDVIAYCRIGERSSHTWFVLRYLLGYEKVRNYDGSWTEWGNTVRAPIER